VLEVNRWATEGLVPDLTIYLAIEPAAALARAGDADRFEEEGLALQERVRGAYERLADAEPERFRRVRADRPAAEVHADVAAAVAAIRAAEATA
jgi:dTMP kinase